MYGRTLCVCVECGRRRHECHNRVHSVWDCSLAISSKLIYVKNLSTRFRVTATIHRNEFLAYRVRGVRRGMTNRWYM